MDPREQENSSTHSQDEVFPSMNQDSAAVCDAASHHGLLETFTSDLATAVPSNPRRLADAINKARESLPVFTARQAIMDSVSEYEKTVIFGESGSGKTTQILQYLAMAKKLPQRPLCLALADLSRRIGCTQPTESAAIAAARRVAEEVGCGDVGGVVGYKVWFEDRTGPETEIIYMTESVLWKEITADPKLSEYSVIMIDKAHERSITTDLVLGLIKKALKLGASFRLVVSTVTQGEAVSLTNYFGGCKTLQIPSRKTLASVEVVWEEIPCSNPVKKAVETVARIHAKAPLGDILVFMSSPYEVELVCRFLSARASSLPPQLPSLAVYPAWRFIGGEIDPKVFEAAPFNTRKVVVSTAVAEASMARSRAYSTLSITASWRGMYSLHVVERRLGMDAHDSLYNLLNGTTAWNLLPHHFYGSQRFTTQNLESLAAAKLVGE